MDLLMQAGESLAGRIEYVRLNPLDVLEAAEDSRALTRLWVRGGFPDSFLAGSAADSYAYRQNRIDTFLERDVPQFGGRMHAETLGRLWTMLAHRQGALLNASKLAANLSVSAPTVNSYIDLLADLMLVRRLARNFPMSASGLSSPPRSTSATAGWSTPCWGFRTTMPWPGIQP